LAYQSLPKVDEIVLKRDIMGCYVARLVSRFLLSFWDEKYIFNID